MRRSRRNSPRSKVQSPSSVRGIRAVATIRRFEEIEAWKESRLLTRAIYDCSAAGAFSKDFPLRDQMRRAAVSVLSNIAEGFERGGDREFVQFLSIAKGSSGELRAQLYIALDQGYITPERFDVLYGQTVKISRLIAGLILYLQESTLRGSKFK